LPGRQEELLEKVSATGKPVILLLFSGRPLLLPWAFEHVPAVIAVWFPGLQGGPALLQVLLGETAPTGKLVVSWPRAVGQIPVYYNALNTGRPAGKVDLTRPPGNGEEKYVSRYIDEQNAPQFPFGYGLTYTELSYGRPSVSAKQLSARAMNMEMRRDSGRKSEVVKVSATVTNKGKRSTEEVVELYVRLQGTSVEEPVRKLQGFQRILLKEGESKKVTFSLGPEAFALWDIRNDWRTEPGRVTIWVSPDAASGEGTELEIAE
jgi:beta-glucosidase